MVLSNKMSVVAMVNGMIGGTILVLPLLALNSGSILSVIVLVVTGFFSYYSCHLCLIHLGDEKDLDYAILKHFSGIKAIKIFYDLVVFVNLILILILYFELIVQQWEGLTSSTNIAIPICNAIGIFILVFVLKYFQLGASVLAYGIISIVAYIIFLTWMLASAPSGSNKMVMFGSGYVGMAAAMGQAYSIQTFFIPVLKKNKNRSSYVLLTLIAYSIGFSAYLYIAYAGSFGILNRIRPPGKPNQTVQDYFNSSDWQVDCLQALYLVHLYSASPEFLIVSSKRLFSAFNIKQTKRGKIPIPQIIYTLVFVVICFVVSIFDVPIQALIEVNGAIIGFFFIYFIPAALHLKCMYYCQQQKSLHRQSVAININSKAKDVYNLEIGDYPRQTIPLSIQDGNSNRQTIPLSIDTDKINQRFVEKSDLNTKQLQQQEYKQQQQIKRNQLQEILSQNLDFTCSYKKPALGTQILEVALASIMFLIGVFIMVNGIISLANGSYKN